MPSGDVQMLAVTPNRGVGMSRQMHARSQLTVGSKHGRGRVRRDRYSQGHVGGGSGRPGRSSGRPGRGAEHQGGVRPDRAAVGHPPGGAGRDRGLGPLRPLHRRLSGAGLGPARCQRGRGTDVDDVQGTRRPAGQKARPTRSMRSRSPGSRCANPTCRRSGWRWGRPRTCGPCWTIART